ATSKHFQSVAGGSNSSVSIPNDWLPSFSPLANVDDSIYDSILDLPTMDEWSSIIQSSPHGKAAGPSGLSYEMIRHFGPLMSSLLHKLVCGCISLFSIPDGWCKAYVYPIPKPTDWNRNLNNTRPITLLESPRKLMVKYLTNKLSRIMASNKVLK